MAIKPLRSNLIGVGVYFVGLGIIVAGGVYGAQALLATVPAPTFLLPETEWAATTISEPRAPIEATVQFKPYVPEARPQTVWKTSVAAAYTASAKPKEVTVVTHKRAESKKKVAKKPAKRTNGAMDAFASGQSWQVPR